jgi:putative transposase
MSNRYKFRNPEGIYFISFSIVDWIDVFVRNVYKDILVESIVHCQKKKGLVVHAYVIMTSNVQMIISCNSNCPQEDIMRDMKKFTSFKILGAIIENPRESRREWLLKMFEENGRRNSNNTKYQFWQQDNHPVELVNNEMMGQRLNYLHNNPVEAGFLRFSEDYLYSSANDYASEKGYIDIEILE